MVETARCRKMRGYADGETPDDATFERKDDEKPVPVRDGAAG